MAGSIRTVTNTLNDSSTLRIADIKLLKAMGSFGRITGEQATRLLYRPGCLTSVRGRLRHLTERGLCYRLYLPREDGAGRGQSVFGLTGRGARVLRAHGGWVRETYHAADEQRRTWGTIRHELAITDFVIAASRLSDFNRRFRLVDWVSEADFRRKPGYTTLDYETVAIQPDGWFDLRHFGLGWWERLPLLLELDRGVERQLDVPAAITRLTGRRVAPTASFVLREWARAVVAPCLAGQCWPPGPGSCPRP